MGVLEKELRLNLAMEQMPTNLSLNKFSCDTCDRALSDMKLENMACNIDAEPDSVEKSRAATLSETKMQLSFSVDRLLNGKQTAIGEMGQEGTEKCENSNYCCCSYTNCLIDSGGAGVGGIAREIHHSQQFSLKSYQNSQFHNEVHSKMYHSVVLSTPFSDCKSVVRPTAIRALGNNCEPAPLHGPFAAMPHSTLMRFHQHKPAHPQLLPVPTVMTAMAGLKTHHTIQEYTTTLPNRFSTKAHRFGDIPVAAATSLAGHHAHPLAGYHRAHFSPPNPAQQPSQLQFTTGSGSALRTASSSNNNNNSSDSANNSNNNGGKRKRSWSRAVFSNLQRKGLEIQFQQQKYITKPDRRKLAARLNLTDAQVKVWFQNRRMKWRHTRENLKSGQEKQVATAAPTASSAESEKPPDPERKRPELGYSTDDSSSGEMCEHEDDGEIDVVE